MGDVDVLVPASRWRQACRLLTDAGLSEFNAPGRSLTAAHDYVRAFTTPDGVILEVHRFVCERTFVSVDYEGPAGIFARSRQVGTNLFIPDDGDLFLTLAVHAAKHTFELPLRSFLDGLLIRQRRRVRTAELLLRAQRWRMERVLHAWLRCLQIVEGEDPARLPGAGDTFSSLGGVVWARTSHEPAWQRLLRMAWLFDSPSRWGRHVGTRALLRVADAVVSGAAGNRG